MPIKRIHPRKRLVTTLTRKWSVICVQLFMAFTIMLPRKTLTTPRPMTNERFFLIVRANVPYEADEIHSPKADVRATHL